MLMIQNSGLGYTEAARQRQTSVGSQHRLPIGKLVLPFLAASLGLSLLVLGVSRILAIVVLIAGLLLSAFVAQQLRAAWHLLADDDAQATVVRGGLARVVRVGDLVPGDSLVLTAGMIVPVDAQGTASEAKGLVAHLNHKDDQLLAGCHVQSDMVVTVTATGNQRLLARMLNGQAQPVQYRQLLRLFIWRLLTLVAQVLPHRQLPGRVITQPSVSHHAVLALMSRVRGALAQALAAHRLRLTTAELTFRYNQGPVS